MIYSSIPTTPANNHLLASVVGLHTWETVDVIRKGANYGYSQREGTEQLNPDKDPDLPGQAVVAGAGRVDMALPWTPPASCTSSARATA